MKKLLYSTLLILFCLASCVQSTSVATVDEDPYKDVPPLVDGDSLSKVYPLAFEGNIIQQEEFEKAMRSEILSHVGKRVKCLEILPWKVSAMMECDDDSFYVAFDHAISGCETSISTKLSRGTAANLSKYEWYEVQGIFKGFPPKEQLQPHIFSRKIKLGVLELDSASVKVYPKEKRAYWENYGKPRS